MPVPSCSNQVVSTNFIEHALSQDWISNTLNILAILISLGVFFYQRHADRKRDDDEKKARISQRHGLVEAVQETIDDAIAFMDNTLSKLSTCNDSAPLLGQDKHLQHVIEPVLDSVSGLQRSVPADGGLALTIARTRRTLVDLHTSRGMNANPTIGDYKDFIEERITDLKERREQLGTLREPGSRLS